MFNRDIDSLILMKLDDEDLERLGSDPAYNRVLNNDMFWRQRTINRFAPAFKLVFEPTFGPTNCQKLAVALLEKYSLQYARNWKEYYASLMRFMEMVYVEGEHLWDHSANGRNDYLHLIHVVKANEEKIRESIIVQTDEWKIIINEVVVNPNVFYILLAQISRNYEYVFEGCKYLLTRNDKRIIPSSLLTYLLRIFHSSNEFNGLVDLVLNHPGITVDDIKDVLNDIKDDEISSAVVNAYLSHLENKLSPEENTRFLRSMIENLIDN